MRSLDNIDGMKYCLKLIDELRFKYKSSGYSDHDLKWEKVLNDIWNEISVRTFRNPKLRGFD